MMNFSFDKRAASESRRPKESAKQAVARVIHSSVEVQAWARGKRKMGEHEKRFVGKFRMRFAAKGNFQNWVGGVNSHIRRVCNKVIAERVFLIEELVWCALMC